MRLVRVRDIASVDGDAQRTFSSGRSIIAAVVDGGALEQKNACGAARDGCAWNVRPSRRGPGRLGRTG